MLKFAHPYLRLLNCENIILVLEPEMRFWSRQVWCLLEGKFGSQQSASENVRQREVSAIIVMFEVFEDVNLSIFVGF